tara:strand:+ start:2275 stop:2604 length:330 start_codon:yes stop_codon:yes gene_type:complete
MKFESKQNCPLNNFEPCKQLECAWFIQLRGNNPNTGEEVDEWGCAIAWQPILAIEGAQQMRQTGAAVESLRNESVKANQQNLIALYDIASVNPPAKILINDDSENLNED